MAISAVVLAAWAFDDSANAATYSFIGGPLTTGGTGCTLPDHSCGERIYASFDIDNSQLKLISAPKVFTYYADWTGYSRATRGLGNLKVGFLGGWDFWPEDPLVYTHLTAKIGLDYSLLEVGFTYLEDRPDVSIGLYGMSAELFDEPRNTYYASGSWTASDLPVGPPSPPAPNPSDDPKGPPQVPLPPAFLSLGASLLLLRRAARKRLER